MPNLNDIVFRLALAKARKLLKHGHPAEHAAERACSGAWIEHRERILEMLLTENLSSEKE